MNRDDATQKYIVWCLGRLMDLSRAGLIAHKLGDKGLLTDKGYQSYKDIGFFVPAREDVELTLTLLKLVPQEQVDAAATLMLNYGCN